MLQDKNTQNQNQETPHDLINTWIYLLYTLFRLFIPYLCVWAIQDLPNISTLEMRLLIPPYYLFEEIGLRFNKHL